MENQNYRMPQSTPMTKEHVSMGGVVGTIIIIGLIILGGLYFWGQRIESNKMMVEQRQEQAAVTEALSVQEVSSSADTNTLEAELNATDIGNIDAELQ